MRAKNVPNELTDKQQAFCEEYIVDLNGTQAAIRAKYSKRTARQMATENLSKPVIQQYIVELKADRSARTQLDADYVLRRLHEIESFNSDTMHNDDGSLKGVSDWPEGVGRIISGIEVSTVSIGGKDDGIVTTKKIKVESRIKALELMGKHVNVKAFEKETLVDLPDGVEFHFHLGKK